MAKILVADDNSNVQKTVTLALANLGIEVLSVNNGEAAVRKLADFAPDLVLADIFMPVRNGYEVCEYVKKDSRFSHVPVVLLVGAFDPLDEREAQRVGADGILKKPFVPPDPLITMVKTLLDRTLGDRLAEVSASRPSSARAKSGGGVATEERPSAAAVSEELPVSDFPVPAGRVAFGDGEHPIAFSQLLETPAQDAAAPETALIEPVDDEQILTSSRDATLGDPIFWRNDEPETEPEEPKADDIDDVASAIGMRSWKQGDDSLPRREDALLLQPIEPIESIEHTIEHTIEHSIEEPIEQSISMEPSIETIEPGEPLEFIREGQDETTGTVVDSASVVLDPADQTPLTVESATAEELAANPIEWMATAPSELSLETSPVLSLENAEDASDETPGWDDPISDSTETIDVEDTAHSKEDREVPSPVSEPALTPVSLAVPAPASVPAFVPVSAEAPKEAAASVSPSIPAAALALPETKPVDATPEPSKTQPSIRPLVQSTEDTVRSVPKQDWADLTASIQPRKSEFAPKEVTPQAASPSAAAATSIAGAAIENSQLDNGKPVAVSSPDPALVEAVVQRVLDKMRPQVVDIITKEFLRPIVQALVTREIEKH